MKNKSIKASILTLICTILIGVILLGAMGILGSSTVKRKYDLLLEFPTNRIYKIDSMLSTINQLKEDANTLIVYSEWYDDDAKTKEYYDISIEHIKNLNSILADYEVSITTDPGVGDEEEAEYVGYRNELQVMSDDFEAILGDLLKYGQGDMEEEMKAAHIRFIETGEKMQNLVQTLHNGASAQTEGIVDTTKHFATIMIILNIIILIAVSLFGIIVGVALSNSISKPIIKLAKMSKQVADGKFDVEIRSNLTNEVGQLSNNFSMLIDSFKGIVSDMNTAFDAITMGRINERINLSKYKGEYNVIAASINKIIDENVDELMYLKNTAEAYANGDFSYACPRFQGEKAVIHESFDMMQEHLKNITDTITNIIEAVNNGNLSYNVNPSAYKGDWYDIITKLNELVSNIADPIRVTKEALGQLSKGNLSFEVDYNQYSGEFKEMLQYIQTMIEFISGYIEEISSVLQSMANQNFDLTIHKDYIGDFSAIKTALELIITNFNDLIRDIMSSSEQVALGAQSIADSSISLAQGVSEQSSAIEELTATISLISDGTNKSMENVDKSNSLANVAKNSAERVKEEMDNLLRAMQEINESSNNISNIIKAIDDIAFQTNILALNAAVEAARAGQHGKGFSVVAEEVRNLATRSSTSAKETSDLIAISLEKAEQGSAIVDRTAATINEITRQIKEISDISNEIANDSKKQNTSIKEVNIGINQIATVISNNTSASEESAAASQELASQSAVFKETVSKFSLKN